MHTPYQEEPITSLLCFEMIQMTILLFRYITVLRMHRLLLLPIRRFHGRQLDPTQEHFRFMKQRTSR